MFPICRSARTPLWAVATMTTFLGGGTALAAPADDLATIRDAISNLRQDYEAKIKDLEDRLQKAEAEAVAAKAAADSATAAAAQNAPASVVAAQPAPPPPEPQAPRVPTSNNAFNP